MNWIAHLGRALKRPLQTPKQKAVKLKYISRRKHIGKGRDACYEINGSMHILNVNNLKQILKVVGACPGQIIKLKYEIKYKALHLHLPII